VRICTGNNSMYEANDLTCQRQVFRGYGLQTRYLNRTYKKLETKQTSEVIWNESKIVKQNYLRGWREKAPEYEGK
jgi:hypothetical protein